MIILSSRIFPPEQYWDVEIWHNSGDFNWKALTLKSQEKNGVTILENEGLDNFCHRVFAGDMVLPPTAGHFSFTVRYRTGSDAPWQWANQRRRVDDGELVYDAKYDMTRSPSANEAQPREELKEYIQGVPGELEIQPRPSESPGAILWSVGGSLAASQGHKSSTKMIPLGVPLFFSRYFALVRASSPWLAPRHGKKEFRLTEDAIFCSFLRMDGLNLLLLAISGIDHISTQLQSSESGEVIISVRGDNRELSNFHVLVAVAEDFESGMSALIYEARKLVSKVGSVVTTPLITDDITPSSTSDESDTVLVKRDIGAQWLADWYDGLTYCTWNSLGQDLSEDKIINALVDLNNHGINISNLIIDDNWQSIDNTDKPRFQRRWTSFEANVDGFPMGLKNTVIKIRQTHPIMGHIAVWHTLMGYWGGISPSGDLANKYKLKEIKQKDPFAGGDILAVDPEDIGRFYDDFYSFLASSGIDAVKTDAQFYLDILEDSSDRRRFVNEYQDAWSIATLRYFGSRAISCMSMSPQLIFHSQLPKTRPAILLRNSDDFFPDVMDSHTWHVFCNAHNSLLTRYLNVIPDWDMFQTSHPYASFHAAARCVSGGPICITDEPGKHNLDLIAQITATTTRGATVILRPSNLGRASHIYHNFNEGNILRIGTYTGRARTGSGILGLFNISATDASSIIPLKTIPGVDENSKESYIIRSYSTGRVTDVMQPKGVNSLVAVFLKNRGWEILTAYPVHSFTSAGNQGYIPDSKLTHATVLGLLGKMTGVAAIVHADIQAVEGGRLKFTVNLKALGVLGVYYSDLENKSIDKHVMVTISGLPVPRSTVWKEGGDKSKILAVDVFAAWKALGLDSGWSNEVAVDMHIS